MYQELIRRGYKPWLDKENLLPGQDWQEEIPRAIRTSDFVLVFLSAASTEKRGYVQREFKIALQVLEEVPEGRVYVIPVKLDDCRIPERFSNLHWAELFSPQGLDSILRAIDFQWGKLRSTQSALSAASTPLVDPLSLDTRSTEMAYSGEDWYRNFRITYVVSPFQSSQISPVGYGLRVGHALTLKRSGPDAPASMSNEMEYPRAEKKSGGMTARRQLLVAPGESVLVMTVEQVCLSSKVLANVQTKASISMKGLMINPVTVPPNFGSTDGTSARLLLFMHNLSGGNVLISEKEDIAELVMHEVRTESPHMPGSTDLEDMLREASASYDHSVVDRIQAYTAQFRNSRGVSEFDKDRQALSANRLKQRNN